jgi:hypothetical protein
MKVHILAALLLCSCAAPHPKQPVGHTAVPVLDSLGRQIKDSQGHILSAEELNRLIEETLNQLPSTPYAK